RVERIDSQLNDNAQRISYAEICPGVLSRIAHDRSPDSTRNRTGLVRSAGIEPATLSLEIRSGHMCHNAFKILSVQHTADRILLPPMNAPPAHHLFTLVDPKASLAGGQEKSFVRITYSAL